jgi:hypothetical protein
METKKTNIVPTIESLVDELKKLPEAVFQVIFKTFESMRVGLGSCHVAVKCFNEKIVSGISENMKEHGFSMELNLDSDQTRKLRMCCLGNGCSKCRALLFLERLSQIPQGESALENPELCETACQCVWNGAGIFRFPVLCGLLRTSPHFGEDSCLLRILMNPFHEDVSNKCVKLFFEASIPQNKLFEEFRCETQTRRKRYADHRTKEIELYKEEFAEEIKAMEEKKRAEEEAALEAKKSKMPKCCICFGDEIDNPPIFSKQTCECKICCKSCVMSTKDLNEKLKYRCPLCRTPFTDDGWSFRSNPVDDSDED